MKVLIAALLILFATAARADLRLVPLSYADLQLAPNSHLSDAAPAGTPGAVPHDSEFKLKWVTVGVMVGTVAVLIAWDVFVASRGEQTESRLIANYSWKYSAIPYTLGILAGHWLFSHEGQWNQSLWPIVVLSVAIVLTWDLLRGSSEQSWVKYPGIWFAVGVPVGALLWGQRHIP